MPREVKKLSHTLYQCKYHIVFCPKYRYRILTGDVAEEDKIRKYVKWQATQEQRQESQQKRLSD